MPLEDMYLLEEKGLLLDISERISDEPKEELLPGALEIGTVDGRLPGVPAAVCFLETLLGEELQSKKMPMCMSVRRLLPEDYLVETEDGRFVFMGGINAPEVPVFQDGSTALRRAKAFLESCVAPPSGYSQIEKIILEELNAMYGEGKSPETTAEIINSRVQLYLDEGN